MPLASAHSCCAHWLPLLLLVTTLAVLKPTSAASSWRSPFEQRRGAWRLGAPSTLPRGQKMIMTHRLIRPTSEGISDEDHNEHDEDVELTTLLKAKNSNEFNEDGDHMEESAIGPSLLAISTSVTSENSSSSREAEEKIQEDEDDEEEDENVELKSLLLNTRGGGSGAGTAAEVSTTTRGGEAKEDTGATMIASVFNLVNNVAGAGILALSAGMTGGTGWIPSVLLVIGLGILSSHSFKIIGEACELTGEADFKGLWSRTISPQSTYMVDSMICIMCFAAAVIYSGILGDVFTPLLDQAGMPALYNGRTSNIVGITATILLPLSLIKNLSALAFTSILGFCAIAYTVFFIVVRALDGSYTLGSGKFVAAEAAALLEAVPAFEKSSLWGFGFTSLVLVSNLGLAFIAHYNAPVFYRQLKDTNSKRFGKMVDTSFMILVALYVVTMTAGYSTFGDVCRGNLLLNYHPHDILSTLGRLATGFSILFGFPLVMCGARESLVGVASSLGWDSLGKDQNHFALVLAMLIFVTVISCSVDDVSLVVGLTGAAMGASIVYICPPILYSKAVKLIKGEDSVEYSKARPSLLLVPFGIFCGALGVYMTIKEAME